MDYILAVQVGQGLTNELEQPTRMALCKAATCRARAQHGAKAKVANLCLRPFPSGELYNKGKQKKQGNACNNRNVFVLTYMLQSSFAPSLLYFCRLVARTVPACQKRAHLHSYLSALALHTSLHSEVEISSFLWQDF